MKTIMILLIAFASAAQTPKPTARGGHDGNGTGVVKIDGEYRAADTLTKLASFDIPEHYEKFDPNTDKDLVDFVTELNSFVRARGGNLFFDLSEYEFYLVSELSGSDKPEIDDKYDFYLTAYTFSVFDPRSSRPDSNRRIVELKKDLFLNLNKRTKGLTLTHEMLHHSAPADHSYISPYIKSLDIILDLVAQQEKGDRNNISNEQLEASQVWQKLLRIRDPLQRKSTDPVAEEKINWRGGGVEKYTAVNTCDNFISANSYVWWRWSSGGNDNLCSNNIVVNSIVKISQSRVGHNTFLNSQIFVSDYVTRSLFKNLKDTSVYGGIHESSDNVFENSSDLIVFLYGGRTKISEVQGGTINISGDDIAIKNLSMESINVYETSVYPIFYLGARSRVENVIWRRTGPRSSSNIFLGRDAVLRNFEGNVHINNIDTGKSDWAPFSLTNSKVTLSYIDASKGAQITNFQIKAPLVYLDFRTGKTPLDFQNRPYEYRKSKHFKVKSVEEFHRKISSP